jgi:hypothetical protein
LEFQIVSATLVAMRTKVILAGAAVASAVFLAACGTSSTPDGGSGATSPANGAGGGNPDRDECLIGTWNVDVEDMADKGAGLMPGATGEGSGSITIVFGNEMTITYDSTIRFKVPIGGNDMVVDAVYTGSGTSTDWKTTGGVLKGTMPVNTVEVTMTASVGGQTVPMGNIPFQGAMSIDEGNLGYTCSGNSATLIAPPPGITWKLDKA